MSDGPRVIAPGVEQWDDRCGGSPTVAGRRVPTRMLFTRFQHGDGVAELARDYELDAAQVEAALRYEAGKRVRAQPTWIAVEGKRIRLSEVSFYRRENGVPPGTILFMRGDTEGLEFAGDLVPALDAVCHPVRLGKDTAE